MSSIIKKLKLAGISAFIIAFIATLFNVYQSIPILEHVKITFVVFFIWFLIIFLLLLFLGLKK